MVGTVSIGSKDSSQVDEARRRIELILDPPTADIGAEYTGKVVNITKFGAFVNILPGRDGLLHISKIGRGKRIDKVEDVFSLGDEVVVRVDDIDNQGKLSLSLAGDAPEGEGGSDNGDGGGRERSSRDDRGDRGDRGGRDRAPREDRADAPKVASFEAEWDQQAKAEFGDLGPAESAARSDRGGDRGGERSRGGRRGGGGRRR